MISTVRLLIGGCAAAVLPLVLLGCSSTAAVTPSTKTLEKFVPAQTLRLMDAAGRELATLDIDSDMLAFKLRDQNGDTPLMFNTGLAGSGVLWLWGNDANMHIFYEALNLPTPHMEFTHQLPRARGTLDWTTDFRKLKTASLRDAVYESLTGNNERLEETLAKEIPSEDLRLLKRKGTVFAALGLSRHGTPSITLVDHGEVIAVFDITRVLDNSTGRWEQWPTFVLVAGGEEQFFVEYPPAKGPVISYFGKSKIGLCHVDPATGKESNAPLGLFGEDHKRASIPWLQHKMPIPRLPIRLVDERNNVLWKAP